MRCSRAACNHQLSLARSLALSCCLCSSATAAAAAPTATTNNRAERRQLACNRLVTCDCTQTTQESANFLSGQTSVVGDWIQSSAGDNDDAGSHDSDGRDQQQKKTTMTTLSLFSLFECNQMSSLFSLGMSQRRDQASASRRRWRHLLPLKFVSLFRPADGATGAAVR